MTAAFRVAYLPANQCWVILFGDAPLTSYPDAGPGRTLWPTRAEAEAELQRITA